MYGRPSGEHDTHDAWSRRTAAANGPVSAPRRLIAPASQPGDGRQTWHEGQSCSTNAAQRQCPVEVKVRRATPGPRRRTRWAVVDLGWTWAVKTKTADWGQAAVLGFGGASRLASPWSLTTCWLAALLVEQASKHPHPGTRHAYVTCHGRNMHRPTLVHTVRTPAGIHTPLHQVMSTTRLLEDDRIIPSHLPSRSCPCAKQDAYQHHGVDPPLRRACQTAAPSRDMVPRLRTVLVTLPWRNQP